MILEKKRCLNLICITLAFSVISCGLSQQDPFGGYPEDVRKATSPERMHRPTAPSGSVVFFDIKDRYIFQEGKEESISIEFRITDPEFERTKTVIGNMDQFNEATYDEDDQKFKWTPPEGFVSPGNVYQGLPLVVQVYGNHQGQPQMYERVALIEVSRGESRPEIVDVQGLEQDFREGCNTTFKILVRDPTSKSHPNVVVSPKYNSLSPLVTVSKVPERSKENPSLWTFRAEAQLYKLDLTKERYLYSFEIYAYSDRGVSSQKKTFQLDVMTNLVEPEILALDEVEFPVGVLKSYTFVVADIRNEGTVKVDFTTERSGGGEWTESCMKKISQEGKEEGSHKDSSSNNTSTQELGPDNTPTRAVFDENPPPSLKGIQGVHCSCGHDLKSKFDKINPHRLFCEIVWHPKEVFEQTLTLEASSVIHIPPSPKNKTGESFHEVVISKPVTHSITLQAVNPMRSSIPLESIKPKKDPDDNGIKPRFYYNESPRGAAP